MRILKLLVFIGVGLIANSLLAQKLTPKGIEADLLNSFKKIDYWANKNLSNYDTKNDEELSKANDVFGKKLSDYAKKYPATIAQHFSFLIKEHLMIATAADGLFRIYSWDTQTGSTMHFFDNVFQFKIAGGTASLMQEPPEGDSGMYYTKVFMVKSDGQTYYLAVYRFIGSTRVMGGGVNVFIIKNDKLSKEAKIIKTQTGLHNSLNYDYDAQFAINDKHPDITFDQPRQTIKIPLIAEGGKPTYKYIGYKFTGQYFEKEK